MAKFASPNFMAKISIATFTAKTKLKYLMAKKVKVLQQNGRLHFQNIQGILYIIIFTQVATFYRQKLRSNFRENWLKPHGKKYFIAKFCLHFVFTCFWSSTFQGPILKRMSLNLQSKWQNLYSNIFFSIFFNILS